MGQQFTPYIIDRGSLSFGCECLLNQDILVSPTDNVHHARATCKGCGRFLRWMPKPAEELS
jgi:hypothetical protein